MLWAEVINVDGVFSFVEYCNTNFPYLSLGGVSSVSA